MTSLKQAEIYTRTHHYIPSWPASYHCPENGLNHMRIMKCPNVYKIFPSSVLHLTSTPNSTGYTTECKLIVTKLYVMTQMKCDMRTTTISVFFVFFPKKGIKICTFHLNIKSRNNLCKNILCLVLYSLRNGLALLHRYKSMRALDGVHQSAWHNYVWFHLHSGWIVTTPLDSQLFIN